MRPRLHRPIIEILRDALRRMESDPRPETPNLRDLKRLVRERIARLKSAEQIGGGSTARHEPPD